ncbi:hypothetical protein NMG60_11006640 [Bertholletia excelsa]
MEEDEQRQRLEMQEGEALSFCLSFNSYSSTRFAEIASKVTEEFVRDAKLSAEERSRGETSNDLNEDDDDFEFSLVRGDSEVNADEIFDGRARQIFPLFNRDLLYHDRDHDREEKPDISTLRLPLGSLFIQDREDRDLPSSSSSEADELEGISPGTYCVWRPKVVEPSPGRCRKSNSTGSEPKRWKFRDLLRRSNSEGKDSFVFLTPKSKEHKSDKMERIENPKERQNSGNADKVSRKVKVKGVVGGGEKALPSAHEAFYVRNRASKEGEKRKSFLPYRQDLVGFFATVNGMGSMGKTLPPF